MIKDGLRVDEINHQKCRKIEKIRSDEKHVYEEMITKNSLNLHYGHSSLEQGNQNIDFSLALNA